MGILRPNWAFPALVAWGLLPHAAVGQQGTPPGRAGSPIADLESKDVEVRRGAATRLVTAAPEARKQALAAMIERLMKEKDGQVRLAILDAVTALGPEAAAAVPALVHTLRTDYGGSRQEETHQDYRSAMALAAIGKPAVEGLRGLLKEKKESVRAEVVMALGRIGPDAAVAVPDLVPLLGDASERIRIEVSRALGRIGAGAAMPLVAATADKDAVVRAQAVVALGYLATRDDRVVQAALRCARDPSPEVRASAIESLSRFAMPDETIAPIVAENLGHGDERVRLAVVDLVARRPALLRRLTPELEALLHAKDPGVSRHAAFLLSRKGRDAVPGLLEALRRDGSRIEPVAEALAQIGRPAVGLLAEAIQSDDSRVRRGAALALGRIRPVAPETARKLTAGLSDPDGDVRAAFLTAIGALEMRAVDAVPAVRGLLNDPVAENRIRAIEVLSRAAPRDDRLIAELTARADDRDAGVERRAIDTLRTLGPGGRRALGVIVKKLGSRDPGVRLAAVEFVESHGQAAVEAIPELTRSLDDPMPKVRMTAARALGGLGKPAQSAVARLTPLLDAEPAEVREAVTAALGSLELDAEVIRPHLARALRDQNAEVRRSASRAIIKLGPQGAVFIPDIILMAEKKENARSVDRLLRRFEQAGPDVRSLPELVAQLDHKQERVRLLAIKFLGIAGRNAREAIPALEKMRDDPSPEIRKQAQAACERIQRQGPPTARPMTFSTGEGRGRSRV